MKNFVNDKYVHSELSGKIIGVAYDVQNAIGPGRPEKTYQLAMSKGFDLAGIKYRQQVVAPILFKEIKVGSRRFDFVVENKVLVELKVGVRFNHADFEQVYEYLKMSGLQLGLIILFSSNCVKVHRVPNVK